MMLYNHLRLYMFNGRQKGSQSCAGASPSRDGYHRQRCWGQHRHRRTPAMPWTLEITMPSTLETIFVQIIKLKIRMLLLACIYICMYCSSIEIKFFVCVHTLILQRHQYKKIRCECMCIYTHMDARTHTHMERFLISRLYRHKKKHEQTNTHTHTNGLMHTCAWNLSVHTCTRPSIRETQKTNVRARARSRLKNEISHLHTSEILLPFAC